MWSDHLGWWHWFVQACWRVLAKLETAQWTPVNSSPRLNSCQCSTSPSEECLIFLCRVLNEPMKSSLLLLINSCTSLLMFVCFTYLYLNGYTEISNFDDSSVAISLCSVSISTLYIFRFSLPSYKFRIVVSSSWLNTLSLCSNPLYSHNMVLFKSIFYPMLTELFHLSF